jgi:arylsulfatase A-like enzyme
MKQPNIIWICTDQQRSDSLGCSGNPVARTPNIDSLAESGTRFTRHITPMQICSPSRATMFTGLYPRHHELITNGMALNPEVPTLTGLLADAGYRTHSVGKQHLQPILAPAEYNMPDSRAFWRSDAADNWNGPYYGFQTVDLLLGESDTAAISGHYARWLAKNTPHATALLQVDQAREPPPADLDEIWRSAIPSELHYNSWISDCASDFIGQANGEDPFFLFVSYPDPHHPFAPPAEYADRYDLAEMPLPRLDPGERDRLPDYYGDLFPTDRGFRELYWAGLPDMEAGSMIDTAGVSDDSMRRAIAHTFGMIEMIDDGVGQILKTLEQQGLDGDTIVLFTSDHGELLGSHGLLHKGPPSYRQLVEISLLMKGPGIKPGQTLDALTNHIDLTPTFLDLAGQSIANLSLDGQSLTPLLSGQKGWQRDANFGEYHPTVKPELYNQTIRTDKWRLSIYPDRPQWGEMFDLGSDPDEHVNLFHDDSVNAIRQELGTRLAGEFPPQRTVSNKVLCKW